jgi:hypothetical protein
MTKLLDLSWLLLGAGVLVGCSGDEEGRLRPTGAAGVTAQAGSAGQGGSIDRGVGGTAAVGGAASNAGAGGGSNAANRGALLEFVPGVGDVPYAIGPNAYGIRGGAFLARSPNGNTITVGTNPGEICISGNLDEVPNGDYGGYWGVEIGFNLNQGAAPVSPASSASDAGDAGSDAAAPAAADAAPEVAQPWVPGEVIGFSFVIEGPTINLVRFKALPAGFDSALESSVFCKTVNATSGVAENALFTEMAQYCWNATANVLVPTSLGFDNISWQLPADVAVGARPFDWCLKELRPILAE